MADIEHEIVVDASPETVFGLLTTTDQHLRWMGTEAEIDPRPGGTYRVLVAGQHPAAGEFLEVEPNRRVVFSFGWEGPGSPVPPGASTVEISLHPEDAKTRVRLVHRGLPDGSEAQHASGWTHYLGRLGVASAGGQAGPDRGPGA